ncbi:MAG: 4Fe-4S binding protein [Clostridia bacterium]|nr:4Fe-4S binding protein [Clostridia bacterium]
MGLLLDVIKTNAVDDHPFLNLSHCVNRNQKHLVCSMCMDICPKGVYDRAQKEPPKWNECQNCGLCVAACRTRCIAPSPVNSKRHLLLAEKQSEIVLSCRRSEKQAGHVEACLALLPWEFLAYLALGGKLILNLKSCRDCPLDSCLDLLEDQLYRLKCFLGEEGYASHVRVCFENEADAAAEGVSRRDFFRSMALSGKKTTALVLNDVVGSKVDAMIYRRMLAERVRALAVQGGFSCRMPLPWIKESCYGCGICALLCPNHALEVSDEQDGMCSIYITPHKCTGCGVCKAVCRDGCIEGILAVNVPHLDRVMLAQVASRSCEACGRALNPARKETLCIACRQKKKK